MKLDTKWDNRFLEMAKLVSTWSRDPSTKVGAVIVGPDRRVISVGYNGFAQGVGDNPERYADRYNTKYKITIHGEENAVLFADRDRLQGSCLYTWPFLTCSTCAAKMIQVGIKRVVSKEADFIDKTGNNDPERWKRDFELAQMQFKEAKVEVVLYQNKDLSWINESK